MLNICKEVRTHIKREMFGLKDRVLISGYRGSWEDEIVLGIKFGGLNIRRIEMLYAECYRMVTDHWNDNYPAFVDEFQNAPGSRAVIAMEENGHLLVPEAFMVYQYEELGYQYFKEIPKNRCITSNWCYGNPICGDHFPERLKRPEEEMNVELARKYRAFNKFRETLMNRLRHTEEIFTRCMEDIIRSKYVRPYPANFIKTVAFMINHRSYVYKITTKNQEWLNIDLVISGVQEVDMHNL